MTPERWQQVETLFLAALGRDASQRAAFLNEVCSNDVGLREEVESLLSMHESSGSDHLLDRTVGGVAAKLLLQNQSDSLAGRTLNAYKIERQIGRGGMGEVYLARDTRLDRPVALKLLPLSLTHNRDLVRRFQLEARAASSLNHPNIVTIHEVGESDELRFIVAEFVEGETLRALLKTGLKLDQALDISIQTASALGAAHNAGIVHRDIKPENIMVRHDGYVKVLDFGLAKLAERAHASEHGLYADSSEFTTRTGMVMGTVKYMSPEQARGQKVDHRTDIFSLGVLLYETITGRTPFDGETANHTIVAILEREAEPITSRVPDAPEQLQKIITTALRKNRDERYQSVNQMRSELEEVRSTLTARLRQTPLNTSAVHAHGTSSAEYLISEIKRHKAKVAICVVAGLTLIAAVSIGLFKLLSGEKQPPRSLDDVQFRKLTNLGTVPWGVISPDGKYVAYAVRDEKGGSYWVKQIATDSTRLVFPPTGPVELWGIGFSTDSNYCYYLIEDTNNRVGGTLYRVPVLGGEPRRVVSDLGWFTVLANGRQILLARLVKDDTGTRRAWFIADIDGGNQQLVKSVPAESSTTIIWSSTGESYLALHREDASDGPVWNLSEVSIADGKEKPILTKYHRPLRFVSWLPDQSGLLLLGPAEAAGADQVWLLSYPDLTLNRVTRDLNNYRVPSITADGKSVVVTQTSLSTAIWSLPAGAPTQAKQITAGVGSIGAATMAPDGKIVYSQSDNGVEDLWEMAADGSQPRQLTFNAGQNSQPSVTADDRYVVFTSTRSGRSQIWRMDRDGGNPVQLTHGSEDRNPSCSPTGQWVVFASHAGDAWAVWKVPLAGGEATRLNVSVETFPIVSPDGRAVAYEYLEESDRRIKLALQPLEGGLATTVGDSDVHGTARWSHNGKALTYVSNKEGRTDIWEQPLAGGAPKKLTDFKAERITSFTWSPDGKRLICTRGRTPSDLVLISNFR